MLPAPDGYPPPPGWLVVTTPVEDGSCTVGQRVDEADAPAHPPEPEDAGVLRQLISNSTDMLAWQTADGTFRYISPACRELLGYDPEELIGRRADEFVHPDDRARFAESRAGATPEGRLPTVVHRALHRQGSLVWLETTGQAVLDPVSGEIVEMQTSSRDVTGREFVERQLRESEQRFRLAMTNAPIGMALVGLDGNWVEVNDRLCQILGRARDELLTMTFQDITHPDDLDTDLGYADRLLAGEIRHYEMEKRYLQPSGEVVWALLSGSLVRDDLGRPLYFIAHIMDISIRKRALLALEQTSRELERSNADLQRYAAVAAHDLRSPLATIVGSLQVLEARSAETLDDTGREVLDIARRITEQMTETVEALLTLSRVGADDLELETVDIGILVDEVVASIGSAVEETGADLQVRSLPHQRGDRAQLRLLFQNLLANALKFRDPSRPLVVVLDAEREAAAWRFTVTDNGRGFDPEDREVIFEPFARTKDGHNVGAAGIGLATCRRIVERHGGTLSAEATGTGARFSFTLPDSASGVS
jgi:PAS domain S-box-containing protein